MPRLPARKISKPPVIDGKIDPEEWKEASHVTGYFDPLTGQACTDQTEAWLAYDDDAIYVAMYAHDVHPEGIVGREITPGSDFNGEDFLTFIVGPNGTRTYDGFSFFRVNVLNTRNETISGGRAAKREWRGEWTSATRRMPDGWCTEFRIPWKVLNYASGGKRTMDLNFRRYQTRTNILSEWANTTAQGRGELFGLWVDVLPPARSDRSRPKFLAYTAPEYDNGRVGVRSGLDVRYAFTPQFTGLLAINPDFKNIESQIEGIQFSRTERFLDEARPFFNDGGNLFQLGGGDFGFARMFYSRRIDSFDWGAKAYGQIGPSLQASALATVESGTQTSGVAKVAKTFNSRTNVNAWFTGTDTPAGSTSAYGFSAATGRGNFNGGVNVATSHDIGQSGSPTAGDAGFEYSVPHWYSLLKYEWIPPTFSSPLAYIPWVDRRGGYWYSEYNRDYRSGPLKDIHFDLFSDWFYQYDGTQQEQGTEGNFLFDTRSDVQFQAGMSRYRFFGEPENLQTIRTTFNNSNRYKRYGFSYQWGTRSGDPTSYTTVDVSWRLFKGFDVGVDWSLLSFDGTDRLGIVTLGYQLGPLDSISGRFVDRNGDRNAYLAYRHSGGSGMEYFVIVGDPNAERWQSRVSVKVVWAF